MPKGKKKAKPAPRPAPDETREPPVCDRCGTETRLAAEDLDSKERGYECPTPACEGRRFLRKGPRP